MQGANEKKSKLDQLRQNYRGWDMKADSGSCLATKKGSAGRLSPRGSNKGSMPPPPELHVDIIIAPGQTRTLVLREEDDPATVAANFAAQHKINKQMQNTLARLLEKQADTFFAQPPEDS
jgi:hypothetical protein